LTKQLSKKTNKKIFLHDLVPSLSTMNMPDKQCKIKHTFVFAVGGQSEAYRPCTTCSTFELWKTS